MTYLFIKGLCSGTSELWGRYEVGLAYRPTSLLSLSTKAFPPPQVSLPPNRVFLLLQKNFHDLCFRKASSQAKRPKVERWKPLFSPVSFFFQKKVVSLWRPKHHDYAYQEYLCRNRDKDNVREYPLRAVDEARVCHPCWYYVHKAKVSERLLWPSSKED